MVGRLVFLCSLCLGACALPRVVPEANGELVPTGEVLFSQGSSVVFDGARVSSPEMSISRRTDGSWGGQFQGEPFDVSVTATSARGVGIVLALDDDSKGWRVTGQWHGRMVRYALTPELVAIHSRRFSFDLKREGASAFDRQGELKLKGLAGEAHPPWPQMAFALLALFN